MNSDPSPTPGQPADYRDTAYRIPDEVLEGLIAKYTRDLTELARLGRFDPVIGRDDELDQIITVLLQRDRANVAICGPAGTGKTALFTALAQAVVAGKVPEALRDARVIELEFPTMAAGTTSHSDFEGRLVPFIKGVCERNASEKLPPIILCIDEMHTMMPTCKATAASGVSDILKPYFTSGDLRVVGATTFDEFRIYVSADSAIERRFQKVLLGEPSVEQTITILKGLRSRYESHFGLTIDEKMCEHLVIVTTKFLRKLNNPDKSIVTLDQACARAAKKGLKKLEWVCVAEAIGKQVGVVPSAIEPPAG